MNDSDDNSDRAGTSGPGDRHIPASDFARRRVADILRRERPRNEQEDAYWNMLNETMRIMKEAHGTCALLNALAPREVLTYGCFRHEHGILAVRHNYKYSRAQRLAAANFNSKFCHRSPAG
jgi:hypothetical protein